jgi:hypothetical protein
MVRLTWMTSRGLQDTGPITLSEAAKMQEQLRRFPNALETLTIWPVLEVAK